MKEEKGKNSNRINFRVLIISSIPAAMISVILLYILRQTTQHRYLLFIFSMLFAIYSVLALSFLIIEYFFAKWIEFFESLAVKVAASKGKQLNALVDWLQVISITLLIVLGVLGLIRLIQQLLCIMAIALIVFPIIVFSVRLAREINYLPKLARIPLHIHFPQKIQEIRKCYFFRRFVFVLQEIFAVRTVALFLAIYIFAELSVSRFAHEDKYTAISVFTLAVIASMLTWVYWNNHGVERLRTRQIIARVIGFATLLICTSHTIYETDWAILAAYFTATLSVYVFADATIKMVIEDRTIFSKWMTDYHR